MWLKSLNFGAQFEEDPLILVPPNFVKFYFLFIFAYSEIFVCLAQVDKKFKFWQSRLRGTSSSWYTQILSNFVFPLYLFDLKISCV